MCIPSSCARPLCVSMIFFSQLFSHIKYALRQLQTPMKPPISLTAIDLFKILADSAHHNQMSRAFTTNTSIRFFLPGVGILHGFPAVEKGICNISNITSQHSHTTSHIELSGLETANTTTYITGTIFSRKLQANQAAFPDPRSFSSRFLD